MLTIRHAALVALLVPAGLLMWHAEPAAAQARPDPSHRELAVAKWFAPILWPAVYENTGPTIPHALAFDGLDNDADGRIDLEDPFETAFAYGRRDIPRLADEFQKLAATPPRRVVYSGPGQFVQGETDVLQYWFYYLYDQGPGSHVHDAEHAFVFLDVADRKAALGELSRYDTTATQLSNAVRVVVGAAHEGSTANNIIAATREFSRSRVAPRQLPTHVPLLAELGKHASAPDLHLDGRFDPGLDANIFRGSLWGLRDSLASGLGEVGFLAFESWQSFPRTPESISVEESYFTDDALKRSYGLYAQKLAGLDPRSAYSLFPMEDLEYLYGLLRAEPWSPATEAQVIQFLDEHRRCFWGDKADAWPGRVSPEAFLAMRQWARNPDDHIRLWEHHEHRRPRDIFKLHLFPHLAFGFGITSDTGGYPSIKRVAIEISDLPWFSAESGALNFLFPGRLFTDSRLEISLVGTEAGDRGWARQYHAFTWKQGRGNRAGFYLGIQHRKAQVLPARLLPDASLERISYETGIDMDVLKTRPGGQGWPLGVRSGIFVGHSWRRCPWSLFEWPFRSGCRLEGQFGLVVEAQENFSDVEQSFGARQNIRIQWGATFTWNSPKPQTRPWAY